MTSEEIIALINSLSTREKGIFSRFVGPGRDQVDYYILYSKLLSTKGAREGEIRKEMGIKSSQAYYSLRKNLGDKILQSLTSVSDPHSYINEALERGAYSLLKKRIVFEMERSWKRKDIDSLSYFHKLSQEINSMKSGFISIPKLIPAYNQVRKIQQDILNLQLISEEIKGLAKTSPSGLELILFDLRERIKEIQPDFGYAKFLKIRAEANISIIDGDYKNALRRYSELTELVSREKFHFWEKYLVNGLKTLSLLSFQVNEIDQGMGFLFRLMSISTSSQLINHLKIISQTEVLSVHAYLLASLDSSNSAIINYKNNPGLFTDDRVIRIQFIHSLVYFLNEEYQRCARTIEDIISFPLALWSDLQWSIYQILFLSLLESGNFMRIETTLNKLRRLESEKKSEYCKASIALFSKLIKNPASQEKEIFSEAISYFKEMKLSRGDKRLREIFDISLWVESKLYETPLKTLWSSIALRAFQSGKIAV